MRDFRRLFVESLTQGLLTHPEFIHVIMGPRQVGKTTGVQQFLQKQKKVPTLYVSADGHLNRPDTWLLEQWQEAQLLGTGAILVVDEIQKVENWSEVVKQVWDRQKRGPKSQQRLVLLGSSSLQLQKGLSESLTGRYIQYSVPHWSFEESQQAFALSMKEFLTFGGYPASYAFRKNKVEWLNYMRESIIAPVLGKDILSLARVKSPALFRQCFNLACSYAACEISYTKLLGQLQDKGNTDLIKHYLELFEGGFLLKQLFKYSNKKVLTRSSSPKILPLCPALYSTTLDAALSESEMGRSFELAVGAALTRLPGELFYWRENNLEVDFIWRFGKKLWAIEVKWGESQSAGRGLSAFQEQHPTAEVLVIRPTNFSQALKHLHSQAAES